MRVTGPRPTRVGDLVRICQDGFLAKAWLCPVTMVVRRINPNGTIGVGFRHKHHVDFKAIRSWITVRGAAYRA